MILMPSSAFRKVSALTASMLLMCLASCPNTQTAKVISFDQIENDYACGPRCLWALMQVTGEGRPDCDVGCIYEIVGKEPNSVTSLKDLKDAAQKLGFSATGYKLGINDLEKMSGFCILPVGNSAGTPQDPLHFILVKKVTKGYAIIINSRTLESQTIGISELQSSWNSYALMISKGRQVR